MSILNRHFRFSRSAAMSLALASFVLLPCFSQSTSFEPLRRRDRVRLAFSSGGECLVTVQRRSPTELKVKLLDRTSPCGTRGDVLTITSAQVLAVEVKRRDAARLFANSAQEALALLGVVTLSTAVGFATESLAAVVVTAAGGVALIALAHPQQVRGTIRLARTPPKLGPNMDVIR